MMEKDKGESLRQLKKLQKYVRQLEAGDDVSTRSLRLLGVYDDYVQRWKEAKEQNAAWHTTPSEFGDYLKLVAQGDKATRDARRSGSPVSAGKAQDAYERALEQLEEILASDPGLQIYLDRPVSIDAANCPSLCSAGIPRLFNSKAQHARGGGCPGNGLPPMTKRELKIEMLSGMLYELENPVSEEEMQRQQSEMDALLKKRMASLQVRSRR